MNRQERSCTSKFRYKSLPRARGAVRDLKQRTGTTEWIRPYKCEFCDGWHIGAATKFVLSRLTPHIVAPAPEPKQLNWAAVTAKVGPDSDGGLFIHFVDDQDNHAYLTIEGNCHVLVMPKGASNRYGDDITPHEALFYLTGHKAIDILEIARLPNERAVTSNEEFNNTEGKD